LKGANKMELVKKIFQKITQLIEKIENSPISLSKFLLAFFCFVFLRNFLEIFSTRSDYFAAKRFSFFFFHSVAFYIFVFLALILILHFITKERIIKISKVIFSGSIVLLLPPLLDLLASGGEGVVNKYRNFTQPENIWQIIKLFFAYIIDSPFGLFFGRDANFPLTQLQINYGIRVEVLIVLIFLIWYIFWKTKNIFRVLAGLFLGYMVFFVLGIFPYLMAFVFGLPATDASFYNASIINSAFDWNKIIFCLYFVFILIFGAAWFYFYDRNKFLAVIRNLRLPRFLLNLVFLFLGLAVTFHFSGKRLDFMPFDYSLIFTACLSLAFYWFFAVFSNDMADEKADKINAPTRPLPSAALSRQEARSLSLVFLGVSYALAFIVGYAFFVIIFLRSCLSYLYSWPPFRLKRVPLISHFVLAICYFLTMLAGYLILSSSSVYDFPGRVSLVFLISFALVANFKDIKDYKGDKADKVYTLPIIFGPKRGKLIIGFLGVVAFLLLPLVYKEYLKLILIPSLVAAAAYFFLVNKKKYDERLIFFLILVYIALIAFLIFWQLYSL